MGGINMKRFKGINLVVALLSLFILVACDDDNLQNTTNQSESKYMEEIAVVSREEGSGARGAFEELIGVNQEDDDSDAMRSDVIIAQGNGQVLRTVQETANGITYIAYASFAGAGDTLRGLRVNGVEPTTANMLSGAFPLVREFNFVYLPEVREANEIVNAFITFASSAEGTQRLSSLGAVVDVDNAVAFDYASFGALSGTLTFGGSTSTEATALALIEEFQTFFPNVSISYDPTGSGAGIRGAIEGDLDLGFASREIRASEIEEGLSFVTYCLDGLVIVVNQTNDLTDITTVQLQAIWTGELTHWNELN